MVVNVIRYVEVSYKGQGSIELKADLPGSALATVTTLLLPAVATRQMVRLQLPIHAKAINVQVRFLPFVAGTLIPYSVSLYAKALGQSVTAWRWIPLPMPRPGEEWLELPIPMPETPEAWAELQIPMPETPEGWAELQIPMPETSEAWAEIPIVSDNNTDWDWYDLPGGTEVST